VTAYFLKRHVKPGTPFLYVSFLLLLGWFSAIAAFSGISTTTYFFEPSSYELPEATDRGKPIPPAPPGINPMYIEFFYRNPNPIDLFTRHYLFEFCNLIPGLEVTKTLKISAAIQTKSLIGGIPILLFKIYIVSLLFGALRRWLK
jgi:hypothetical protein